MAKKNETSSFASNVDPVASHIVVDPNNPYVATLAIEAAHDGELSSADELRRYRLIRHEQGIQLAGIILIGLSILWTAFLIVLMVRNADGDIGISSAARMSCLLYTSPSPRDS